MIQKTSYTLSAGALDRNVISSEQSLTVDGLGLKSPVSVDFSAISEVIIKPVSLTGGSKTRVQIIHQVNGTSKKFPDSMGFEGETTGLQLQALIAELRKKATNATFTSANREPRVKESQNGAVVSLSPQMFGTYGGTFPIWLVVGLWTVCFAPLILPIPYGLFLINKGFRLTFTEGGLHLRKMLAVSMDWDDIESVGVTEVALSMTDGLSLDRLIDFDIYLKSRKKLKLSCGYPEAKYMSKRFAEHGKIDSVVEDRFAA